MLYDGLQNDEYNDIKNEITSIMSVDVTVERYKYSSSTEMCQRKEGYCKNYF